MPRARTTTRRSSAQKAALAKAQVLARELALERRATPLDALLTATRQRAQTGNIPDLRARLARERIRAKDFAKKLKEEQKKAKRAAKEVDVVTHEARKADKDAEAAVRMQTKREREARKAEERAGRAEKEAEASRRTAWEVCERADAAEKLLAEERQMKELWRALYMRSEMQGAQSGGAPGASNVGRILQDFAAPVADHDDILSTAAPWRLPHAP